MPVGKLQADWGMQLFNTSFFIEADRDTEPVNFIQYKRSIEQKVDNYIEFSDKHRLNFHVIFSIKCEEIAKRESEILTLLLKKKRNLQFLVTDHTLFINDPLGKVLISPYDRLHSLEELSTE